MFRLALRLSTGCAILASALLLSSVAAAPPSADIAVGISASPSPVFGGANLTYTVTVSNAGGAPDATGVVLQSYLPPGGTFVSATPASSCVPSPGYVTCALGTVTASSPVVTEIVVTAPSPASDTSLASFAYVSGTNEPVANQGNNSAANVTTVLGQPDVTLSKTASPDPVVSGANLTYTLTAHNVGTGTAAGVTIADPLPAGTTFISGSPGCTNSAGTVTCTLGSMGAGLDAPAQTVTVQVPSVAVDTIITNTATVSATNVRPAAQGNNTATVAVTVPAPPDVTLTKAASANPVTSGDALTYTLTAHNVGPGPAAGVTITDPLPAGTTFVSASAGCADTAGTVTCAVGTLAAGASAAPATITVDAPTTTATTTLTNTASVSATNEPTANQANNSGSSTIGVNLPDLAVGIAAAPNPGHTGDPVAYTLSVRNIGTGTAHSVQLTDQIDPLSTFVSAPGCLFAALTVSCSLSDVPAGSTMTVTVTVTAPHVLVGTNIANSANVLASNEPSASQGNNSAAITTLINADPDVTLTFTALPNPVAPAATLIYVAQVRNLGSLAATGVQIVETLPPSVMLQPLSPGCSAVATVVTCALGTLAGDNHAPGGPDEATVYVSVTTPSVAVDTTISAAAGVSAINEPASNTGNNSASVNALVAVCGIRLADLNHDGVVNILDLSIAATLYMKTSSQPGFNPAADLNHDGVINILDLAIIGSYYSLSVSACP
ncbi:MAG: dockerin type I domain-containing protein [Dehalococcoidia bacterium]